MLNSITDLSADFFENFVHLTGEQVQELPAYFVMLSDLEIGYTFTLLKVSGYRPSLRRIKLPGYLYAYIPDQRPITLQLIGKPSSGPSPPRGYCNS